MENIWMKSSDTVLHAEEMNVLVQEQAYDIGPLDLDIGNQGLGGIDQLPIQNWRMYHIFAVLVQGTVRVVASIRGTPLELVGTRIGFFTVDGAGHLLSTGVINTGNVGDLIESNLSEADFITQMGPGWIAADGRNVGGSLYTRQTTNSTVPNQPGSFIKIA